MSCINCSHTVIVLYCIYTKFIPYRVQIQLIMPSINRLDPENDIVSLLRSLKKYIKSADNMIVTNMYISWQAPDGEISERSLVYDFPKEKRLAIESILSLLSAIFLKLLAIHRPNILLARLRYTFSSLSRFGSYCSRFHRCG